VLLSLLLSATAKCSRRSTGAPPTTECPRNAIHGLDPRHHQLAKLIDIAGLGADDHVVGAGDVLGQLHTLDRDDILGNPDGLADLGLNQDVCRHHNQPPPCLATAGTNPS
jgi:hypothetical protein